MPNLPTSMRAVAIDQYGGVDQLKLRSLPLPTPGDGEVLIRVTAAGVAVWDPIEREGHFEDLHLRQTPWPLVLGSEAAGEVVTLGGGVTTRRVGEQVYATGFLNPKGGFYAEYAAVKAELVFPIPPGMKPEQAAVLGGDGGTALRGLEDVLKLRAGESVLIFGAGGGIGHLAVQFAKRLGAKVFAIASGSDGVNLALSVGADAAINGRSGDVAHAGKAFAPRGIDAALVTAGGEAADRALALLKPTGRCAYPNGVMPTPKPPSDIAAQAYDGNLEPEILRRVDALVRKSPFAVTVSRTFLLEQAADAQQALGTHYLGKLALKIG